MYGPIRDHVLATLRAHPGGLRAVEVTAKADGLKAGQVEDALKSLRERGAIRFDGPCRYGRWRAVEGAA